MVASQTLLFELQSVLMRQKFRRYRPEADCLDYVLWISDNATLRQEGRVELLSRDPDDDYLLALAENSSADYLVSGDGDLLDLDGIRIRIIPPRDFHGILESANEER